MSAAESREQEPSDLLSLVQRDHHEIEQLMFLVESTGGAARRHAFEDLVRMLAVHETAEEEIVHPLAQRVGADGVASELVHEEAEAKKALAKLDGSDVSTDGFRLGFERLKVAVLTHAAREEREEHPRLRADTSLEQLEQLGRQYALAEQTAPTHPHPGVPPTPGANLALGPIFAIADRVRDALRSARRDG